MERGKLSKGKHFIKILLLMLIPWTALVFTAPIYNRKEPYLGGWPFLYWYLFSWIFIQPVLTFIVFKFIDRERW
ncbi:MULTISPECIES: DUF3311 domain-containing protein [Fervidicoccus]|uniref:DUF3311 domain-containing protein n=2 Tax=Fervidicoccus fontis TaxID=683846 RepID=I0A0F5_FERFK|nr:DUF3311 domain-containing protein [Fervidicoccus fontis]AFH42462.1 hypothetical protein FFONT_0472 [Fervidicoccus fontis Kam940]